VVSEKKAMWLQSVKQLKNGDIFEGKVNYVTDFGAFVDLRFPDGLYNHELFLSAISFATFRYAAQTTKQTCLPK
jgi:DNA-directed RNA polymerase subunit E'/Rpb7